MSENEIAGQVEFFNNPKGWGVIAGEDGASYFVHHSQITDKKFFPDGKVTRFRTLKSGQKVIFIRLDTGKQMNSASNVRIAAQ